MITSAGVVSTIAGSPGQTGSTDGTNGTALFSTPRGIAVDGATNVYVADSGNSIIRKLVLIGTNWVVTTLAGSSGQSGSVDGPGSVARFHGPYGLTVDHAGNIYAVDRSNDSIRKITPGGVVTTFAGVGGLAGSADGIGAAAQFDQPVNVAVDGSTNIYVADFQNRTVRKISPVGTNWVVTTLAGTVGVVGTNDGPGNVALFNQFHGIGVDGDQNVYVTDTGNFTLRKITPEGIVSTLAGAPGQQGLMDGTGKAARFGGPIDVVSDASGNLTVVDGYSIRQVSPAGAVSTIAGCPSGGCTDAIGSADGPGATARFDAPGGIARDTAGNLYVADTANDTIRKLTYSSGEWMVTTLAGLVGQTNSTAGVGMDARFDNPMGVAVDASGAVYVGDTQVYCIAKGVPASAGTPLPPVVQFETGAGNLTLSNNAIHFSVTSSTNGAVVLQTSTDLKTWATLQTNSVSGGTAAISIPIDQVAGRFFRAVFEQSQ